MKLIKGTTGICKKTRAKKNKVVNKQKLKKIRQKT